MKGITRITVLVALVLILSAAMATNALAKPKVDKPGGGGGGGGTISPDPYIYPDELIGYVTSGNWVVEDYTGLETGGTKILVANDAGATITYTIPAGYTHLQLAAATYWSCGEVEVSLDGISSGPISLNSAVTAWGQVFYNNHKLNAAVTHTLTITCLGTGGPTSVTIGGVTYPVSGLNFVNVQYLRYW